MKRNKKGQAAMEFLMTYGWAILVVLAAIGALAYFGILSPDRWLPTKCTMAGGFSCIEHKEQVNSVYVVFQNNLGADVADTWSLDFNGTDCDNQHYAGNAAVLQNGDQFNYTFTCAGATSVGQRVRGKFTLTYQKAGETSFHEASGDLSSKVEN